MIAAEDILGHHELAEMLGISKQNLVNWRRRKPDFPQPFQTLAMTPLWDRKTVRLWAERNNVVVREPQTS